MVERQGGKDEEGKEESTLPFNVGGGELLEPIHGQEERDSHSGEYYRKQSQWR